MHIAWNSIQMYGCMWHNITGVDKKIPHDIAVPKITQNCTTPRAICSYFLRSYDLVRFGTGHSYMFILVCNHQPLAEQRRWLGICNGVCKQSTINTYGDSTLVKFYLKLADIIQYKTFCWSGSCRGISTALPWVGGCYRSVSNERLMSS